MAPEATSPASETPKAAAGDGVAGESGAAPAPEPPKLHIPTLSTERLRLAYLLALFLVRRRMLKWEGIDDDHLRLRCKESDRPVGLPVPPWTDAELEQAVTEFEELFR